MDAEAENKEIEPAEIKEVASSPEIKDIASSAEAKETASAELKAGVPEREDVASSAIEEVKETAPAPAVAKEGEESLLHASLHPGARVKLTGLQARPDLNDTQGYVVSYDAAKARWAVKLRGSTDSNKLFKAANLALQPCCLKVCLEAAVVADADWCKTHLISQLPKPDGRDSVVDPIMSHIELNVCAGNSDWFEHAKKAMNLVRTRPDRKDEMPLDDARLNPRVAHFLRAYRDAA